ncbi:MAG: hypothetical protein V1661_00885 [bacterium]
MSLYVVSTPELSSPRKIEHTIKTLTEKFSAVHIGSLNGEMIYFTTTTIPFKKQEELGIFTAGE